MNTKNTTVTLFNPLQDSLGHSEYVYQRQFVNDQASMDTLHISVSIPMSPVASPPGLSRLSLYGLRSHNESAVCSRCQGMFYCVDGLPWTGCGHWYCQKCAEQVVNLNLSHFNEMPKCCVDKCGHKLDPVHFHGIARHMIQALDHKYHGHRLNMHNTEEHVHSTLLFHGFLRESWPSDRKVLPSDVIGIILDYFKFTYYASFNRGRFDSGRAGKKVVKWSGVDEANRLCDAKNFEMVLDFQMLRKRQVQCAKCRQYHPKDTIVHWTGCHHPFCRDCVTNHFSKSAASIWKDMIPQCPLECCHEELSKYAYEQAGFLEETQRGEVPLRTKMRDLMYSKHGGGFYCAHCRHWHGDQDAVRWSCGHRYGKWCALQMLTEVIPTCSYMDTVISTLRGFECLPRCEAIVGVTENKGCIEPKYCMASLRVEEARAFGTCDHGPSDYNDGLASRQTFK